MWTWNHEWCILMTSAVPPCAQPLAPFDCECIVLKKIDFWYYILFINASSTTANEWGPCSTDAAIIIGGESHGKHMSNDILTCKQMYRKNWLYCFEVKRTLISQKNDLSVSNGMRSGFVKVTTVSSFHSVLSCSANTPDSTVTIKKFHQWRRIHMNKWIDCDQFRDDQVNKWGPTTTTGFAEAEERARHRAKKWSGTIWKWRWAYSTPLSRVASGGSANSDGAPWEKLQNLAQSGV